MHTTDILAVLRGQQARAEERHPDARTTRAARAKAYQLLYKAAERHGLDLTARVYVDPLDDCLLVCDTTPREAPASKYEAVLALRVGETCELILGNTLLQSVKARLKELAAQVEAELGARPCWVARPIPGHEGAYEVTRLADGTNPATGMPRHDRTALAAQAEEEQSRRDHARMWQLDIEWNQANERAFDLGQDPPPMPAELAALERKHGISKDDDEEFFGELLSNHRAKQVITPQNARI